MTEGLDQRDLASSISQRGKAELRRLEFDHTLIVRVDAGTKTIRNGQQKVEAKAGDLVVIPRQFIIDIINMPTKEGTNGIYQASILALSPETLGMNDEATPLLKSTIREPLVVRAPAADLIEAFQRAHDSLGRQEQLPAEIVRNRTREVVLWIEATTGLRFASARERASSFSRSVRRIVSADLTHRWACPYAAKRLAVSDATLRRRLRAENTTFADQVLEARLMRALELLQSSDLPVTSIAAAVGYESPSRFAERFKERFGATPSAFRAESPN
jgi:AraC-like DNA-binding protein